MACDTIIMISKNRTLAFPKYDIYPEIFIFILSVISNHKNRKRFFVRTEYLLLNFQEMFLPGLNAGFRICLITDMQYVAHP